MTTYDLWVMRDEPIKPEAWFSFSSKRTDLRAPDEVFGRASDGAMPKISTVGLRWWMGHSSGMPIPVVLSAGAVHIGAGDGNARELAEQIAAEFGGFVQEG